MTQDESLLKTESLPQHRSRRRNVVRLAAWSIAAVCVLLSGYVTTYWALHWMMYRQWISGNGFDRQMSRVVRTPGDLYATSDLPGSRWWDQRKREWQRRGRRAYVEERQARSREREAEQLRLFYAERERRRLEERPAKPDVSVANPD